jgi:hypothetical protein
MSKKINCPKCSRGFNPTMEAFALGKAACPVCGSDIPLTSAQAMEALDDSHCARGRFAQGEPVQLPPGTSGDEFDIQWMPPGRQAPVAFVSAAPRELKFSVNEQQAQAFDTMLQRLRALAADGKGDLPFIDFNHDDSGASGRPTQFYWGGDDPKTGGIRLKGKWTAKGKAAVSGEAPEFTRFSPEWYFDDHDEPMAIGVNLGGLVNRAAFKTIASVKAGAANQQPETNMTETEIQDAITNGIAAGLKPIETKIAALETAQGKSAQTDEPALTKAIAKAMEPFTQKITGMETAALETRKAQAKAAVKTHIDRGAIAPEEKLPSGKLLTDYYEEQYLANASDAEAALKKLPGKNLGRVIVGAGNGGTSTGTVTEFSEPENRAIAGARKLREQNKALATDAQALEAWLHTPEGNAAYADILAERSSNRKDLTAAR